MMEYYIKDKVDGLFSLTESDKFRRINLVEKNSLKAALLNEIGREVDDLIDKAHSEIMQRIEKIIRDKL